MITTTRDTDQRVTPRPEKVDRLLPLNYELPSDLNDLNQQHKNRHINRLQNNNDDLSSSSPSSDTSDDDSIDSRNIYSPSHIPSRYSQQARTTESDNLALSRIQHMQNNAKPPTCMDKCLSCLGLTSIDATYSKKYAQDLVSAQISLRINTIHINVRSTIFDILGPLNNSKRRWRLLLLTLKAAAAFRKRGRTARYVLGPNEKYRHQSQSLWNNDKKRNSYGWIIWCSVIHFFVCMLWIFAPLDQCVELEKDPLRLPSMYMLIACDVAFFLCALETIFKGCCQCYCINKSQSKSKRNNKATSRLNQLIVTLPVLCGMIPINAILTYLGPTVVMYANRQSSSFVRSIANGSFTLNINIIRGVIIGVSFYVYRFLKAMGNRHDSISRSTILFWTRDVILLVLFYHWAVVLRILTKGEDIPSTSKFNVADLYLQILTTNPTSVSTWKTWLYEMCTTIFVVVLIVRSVSFTLSNSNVSSSSIHRWIKTHQYESNEQNNSELAENIKKWWFNLQKKGEMENTLITASGSHATMLRVMPSLLRRACEKHSYVRYLQELEFLSPWTTRSSTMTSLNQDTSLSLRRRLAATMYSTTYACNEIIVQKNEPITSLCYLLAGRVALGEKIKRSIYTDTNTDTIATKNSSNVTQRKRSKMMNILKSIQSTTYHTTSSLIDASCWFNWGSLGYIAGGLPFPSNDTILSLDHGTTVVRLDGDVLYHSLHVMCPNVLDTLRVDLGKWQKIDGRHRWKTSMNHTNRHLHRPESLDDSDNASILSEDTEEKKTRQFRQFKKFYEKDRRKNKKNEQNTINNDNDNDNDNDNTLITNKNTKIPTIVSPPHQQQQQTQVPRASAIDIDQPEEHTRVSSAAHDDRVREWPDSEPICRVKLNGPTIASHLKNRTGTRGEWIEKAGRYNIILDGKSKGRSVVQVRVLPHDIVVLSPTMKEKKNYTPMELPDIYYKQQKDNTIIQIHRGTGHMETADDMSLPGTPQTDLTNAKETHPAALYRQNIDNDERNSEDEFDAFPSNQPPPSRGLLKTFLDDPDSAAVTYESAGKNRKNVDQTIERKKEENENEDELYQLGNKSHRNEEEEEDEEEEELEELEESKEFQQEETIIKFGKLGSPLPVATHEVKEVVPVEEVIKKDPLNLLFGNTAASNSPPKVKQEQLQQQHQKIVLGQLGKKDSLNLLGAKQATRIKVKEVPIQKVTEEKVEQAKNAEKVEKEEKVEKVVVEEKQEPSKPKEKVERKEMRTLLRALHEFPGMEDDDLSLQKGNLFWGLERRGDWWFGETYSSTRPSSQDGTKGLFPGNYVELVEKSGGLQKIEQLPLRAV